jgi:nucleoside 2-deoxyribosyltransferase
MISSNIARVVLCGSFRKDKVGIERAYDELIQTGCMVVSPHRIVFDDHAYARDDAEQHLTVKTIEDHHLMSIQQADFVWLHAPDGYVGNSASFEIGYAVARGIPVFSKARIADEMLSQFVVHCGSVYEAKQVILDQE